VIQALDTKRSSHFEKRAVGGEEVSFYFPGSLPPDPCIDLSKLQNLLEKANQALGRLDGISAVLPDPGLFLYSYIRKEALLSSQIEGTQSSLSDLLLFEQDEVEGLPIDDVQEVLNYTSAMDLGLKRLAEGMPLSLRLLREIHGELLSRGRGSDKQPGAFRSTQNWIGGSRPGNAFFVPPPPELVLDYMSELERFLHSEDPSMPLLVKAAIAHVQFESIHPFLDGNGRLGRLLITFLLCHEGAMHQPMLYLSLYLKQHRDLYYRLLTEVRTNGSWAAWIDFFLRGIQETADQAVSTARRIQSLHQEHRASLADLKREAASVLRVFEQFQRVPGLSIRSAQSRTGLSFPSASKAMKILSERKILREVTGKQRGQVFVYDEYLKILSEGTEPLARNA
jgi:Fic family protein